MKKIALTAAAALLVSAGAAFAGSDHYGSDGANQPAVSVDNAYTASIHSTAAQDNGYHAQKQVTEGAPRLGGNS